MGAFRHVSAESIHSTIPVPLQSTTLIYQTFHKFHLFTITLLSCVPATDPAVRVQDHCSVPRTRRARSVHSFCTRNRLRGHRTGPAKEKGAADSVIYTQHPSPVPSCSCKRSRLLARLSRLPDRSGRAPADPALHTFSVLLTTLTRCPDRNRTKVNSLR